MKMQQWSPHRTKKRKKKMFHHPMMLLLLSTWSKVMMLSGIIAPPNLSPFIILCGPSFYLGISMMTAIMYVPQLIAIITVGSRA
jgi:hypothetical protein